MQLLRLLINPGFITTKISWPLYTPQFKTFNITLTSKPTKGSKILPGLTKPCMIIPGQFDMIHHVSTSDHNWKILIHNSSKKVIDQVNTVCKEYQKSLNQS